MVDQEQGSEELSPWWRRAVILIVVVCFGIQVWIAA